MSNRDKVAKILRDILEDDDDDDEWGASSKRRRRSRDDDDDDDDDDEGSWKSNKANKRIPLSRLVARFLEANTFKLGDKVRWKNGLQNKSFPKKSHYGVVVEVIDPPFRCEADGPTGGYYGERLDIMVAVRTPDGIIQIFPHDSRRFEPYEEESETVEKSEDEKTN